MKVKKDLKKEKEIEEYTKKIIKELDLIREYLIKINPKCHPLYLSDEVFMSGMKKTENDDLPF